MKFYMLNELNICDKEKSPVVIDNTSFIEDLKSDDISNKNIYIISTKNKEQEEYLYKNSFLLSGIEFNNITVLEPSIDRLLIDEDGVIILDDDATLNQMDYLVKENLIDFIKNFKGIIIAVGNSVKNLSAYVIDEKEEDIYHPGIGISDIIVEPDFDKLGGKEMRYSCILSISLMQKIYGLSANSYIKKDQEGYKFIGDIKEIFDTEIRDVQSSIIKKYRG